MPTEQQEQINRDWLEATRLADAGGRPPSFDGPRAALLAVGIFMLLDVFAAITLPDRNAAFWPVVIFTVLIPGTWYVIAERLRKAWSARQTQALQDIWRERARREQRDNPAGASGHRAIRR